MQTSAGLPVPTAQWPPARSCDPHFSLQALGHDPVRLGTPLGIWGVYAKDQHAQSLTRSLTYQKSGLHFKFWRLFCPSHRVYTPARFGHWVLDVRKGRVKGCERWVFWPPSSRCNWISGYSGVFLPPTGRFRKRASRCRGLQKWDCGVEVKAEFLCNRRPCPPTRRHKTTAAARERGDGVLVLRCI